MDVTRSPQRAPQRPPQRAIIRTSLNRYEVDESRIPPGTTYQWCTHTVMGAENVEQQINDEANGWVPVPPDRHPELVGRRGATDKAIIRGGLILCERQAEITEEVREQDTMKARHAVANQLQRLNLDGHRSGGRGIKTTYVPAAQEVPED